MKRKHFIQAGIIVLMLFSCNRESKKAEQPPAEITLKDSEGIKKYREEAIAEKYTPPVTDTGSLTAKTNARVASFYHLGATGRNPQSEWFTESLYFRNYKGVAMSTPVHKLRPGGSKIKSCWIAFYYHVTMPDGTKEQRWIQWGYAVHKDWGLIPAFFIYRINPTYILSNYTFNMINDIFLFFLSVAFRIS